MLARSFAGCFLAASAFAFGFAPAAAHAHEGDHGGESPIVDVKDLYVEAIDLVEDELVATVAMKLDVAGRTLKQTVEVPIEVTGATADDVAGSRILHLSLGPIRLNVLGLIVDLDDCARGPVTVDITAFQGGGLLGDLLYPLGDRMTTDGETWEEILASLTEDELADLTGALEYVLSETFLESLLNCEVVGHHGDDEMRAAAAKAKRNRCDILTLEVPEGIVLNLLGLEVETSPICLDIFARRGDGNLLGNLLCSLTELLDDDGTPAQIRKLTRRIWDAVADSKMQL